MRNLLGLILILMLAFSASAQDAAMKQRLDAVIDKAIKDERIVGLDAVVAQNGKVVYRRAAGFNDREAKRQLREDDVFRLASLTKLIVSVAALALVDEGKLSLDDAVTKYLPDFRPKLADGREPKITVRHLLTHTAGLNYVQFEKPDGAYHRLNISNGVDDITVSLDENLRRIAVAPLLFEPGTAFQYSVATDVLGAVVAKAGGASLPEVVRRKVTQPLKMKDTEFLASKPARLVVPYADGNSRPVRMTDPFTLSFEGQIVYSPSRATNPNAFPSGGGGMVGTIDDYLRFLEALRKGGAPVLKPETARLIVTNQIGDIPFLMTGEGWGWSLGLAVLKDPSVAKTPKSVGTWEWGGVYGHHYFVDPQKQLTVIVMTNTAVAGLVGEFPQAIVNAIYSK